MSTRKSPPDCYTTYRTGRSQKYPFAIAAQLTIEQKEFLDSECQKLGVSTSEYIRTILQDLMDEGP